MKAARVVLDTNVLISALVFQADSWSWMRSAWRSGNLIPLASRQTVAELVRVLKYPKFALSTEERQELLDDYLPYCEIVAVSHRLNTLECRDPFDQAFLQLALAGSADALVTDDADIQALAADFPVAILTPASLRQLHFEYE